MKAIITGAGKGIGKEISFKLSSLGYDLLLISRNKTTLEQTKNELLHIYPNNSIDIFSADLSVKDWSVELKRNYSDFDPDVLINNVGAYFEDKAIDMDMLKFNSLFRLNFLSAVELCHMFLPQMKNKKKSFVINICSVAAVEPRMEAASYSISKNALKVWGDLLRKEVAKDNIMVSNIFPGSVATPSWEGSGANVSEMIQTKDIADAVGFILGLSKNANCNEIHLSPIHAH